MWTMHEEFLQKNLISTEVAIMIIVAQEIGFFYYSAKKFQTKVSAYKSGASADK